MPMPTAEPKRKKPAAGALDEAIRKNLTVLDRDHAKVEEPTPHTLELQDVRAHSQRDPDARLVSMAAIRPDPHQVRTLVDIESDEFRDLVANIEQQGLLQAITVRWLPSERIFEIVTGHRRYHAAKALGWRVIRANVRDVSDEAKTILQLTENIHRQNLSPLEEARAFRQYMEQHHLTHEQVAKEVGKSRVYVTESVTMLDKLAPDELRFLDQCRPADMPGKSLILAALRVPDAETRGAILHGELTRHEAREHVKQAQPRTGRPKHFGRRYALEGHGAMVTVTFKKASASEDEIGEVLMEAYKEHKKRARREVT